MKIKFAENEEEIIKCFPVMSELRTHLKNADELLQRVKRQKEISGFQLAYLEDNNEVKSAAGIRISENLAWGKYLYVDDLVTLQKERSNGYGQKIFDWLVNYANENNCDQFHLDSGVQRFGAHRFYLMKKMNISSHHFTLILK